MEKDYIDFRLVSIKTEQFALLDEKLDKESTKYNLTSTLEFKVSSESKVVGVFLTFSFFQKKDSILKIQTSCNFQLEDDSWQNLVLDNKIQLPITFLRHITMLSVGTTRGILHEKTSGTFFNRFILPAINVNELVKNDAELVLKS